MDAIEVNGLVKRFNGFTAVNNVSFTVKKGELFGFLGPNGAGKSTTIYILATLLKPTAGSAFVNGLDVMKEPEKVRSSIGIVFQDPTVDTRLSAFDNLDIHGRMYGLPGPLRKQRIKEVLELVELTDWKEKMVKTFSGGMRRRLEIARGLMHTPQILILDEPTLGLDPQTRRHIWSYIEKLRGQGITIMLTTHYLEEADFLCDRIAIIDHGKIKVLDTPKNLKESIGGIVISADSRNPKKLADLVVRMGWSAKPLVRENTVSFETKEGGKLVPKIMEAAIPEGIEIESLEVRMPSLEDVFIYHTGLGIREEKAAGSGMIAMRRMRARGN